MERWDLYDENRRPTGEIMLRGQAVPEGRYHLTVDLLFLNSRGETLLQRRAKSFLSKAFGHKTEISAFLSAALAFCSQLW